MRPETILTVLLLATAGATELAAAEPAALRWSSTADSELQFTAFYENEPLPGRFRDFQVTVHTGADPASPTGLKVRVKLASADMNDAEVNAELGSAAWFDSHSFPVATYSSRAVIAVAGGGFIARGTLSLKGLERELQLPFEWRADSGRATLEGKLELSRLEWNVGSGEWADTDTIADRVELRFSVRLRGAD
jgi:polyisoprenoid-binding protein YceI